VSNRGELVIETPNQTVPYTDHTDHPNNWTNRKTNVDETRIDVWKHFGWRNPAQAKFLESPAKYRLFSSGYGGGKSYSGCRESIRYAVNYPGSRNMVSRLHYPDLKRSTFVTFMKSLDAIGFKRNQHYRLHEGDMTITWWNKSHTIFTNLDDEEKFGSVEASTWFIDEGSEVPDSVYQVIFPGRLRWHLPSCQMAARLTQLIDAGLDPTDLENCGCPLKGWVCTNPGASGYLRKVTRGQVPGWEWVPVAPGDNIYNPPGYNEELAAKGKLNGEHWYKRYVLGSWDAFEGQRFPMLDEKTHLIDNLDKVASHHVIYEGWDFGWRNPTHVTWVVTDPKGEDPPVVIADYSASEREPRENAKHVHAIRTELGMKTSQIYSWGDPAGRQHNIGRSYIDEYHELGIHIAPCDHGKSPHYRADHIAKFLVVNHVGRNGVSPGLLICRRAQTTWESMTQYRVKETSNRTGEDPKDAFHKHNDHGVDSLGYAIINVQPPVATGRDIPYNPHKPTSMWNRPKHEDDEGDW
jgi:hypothetical protein